MTRKGIINPKLLKALEDDQALSYRQVYRQIKRVAEEETLELPEAAIHLAKERGLKYHHITTPEERTAYRDAISHRSRPLVAQPVGRTVKASRLEQFQRLSLDLGFITDNELLEILKRDIGELNCALSKGMDRTKKTCMILAGSIAEAILLESLKKVESDAIVVAKSLTGNDRVKEPSDLEQWNLANMIEVATRLKPQLLPDDSRDSASLMRNWRNLIHPGRELKETREKRIQPTVARARSAIAFLEHLVYELNQQTRRRSVNKPA